VVLDPGTLAFVSPAHGKVVSGSVHIAGIGTAPVKPLPGFSIALPSGVDGSWTLSLDILALKRLGGTATASIDRYTSSQNDANSAPSTILSANLQGSYNARSGVSTVAITGTGTSRGTSLVAYFTTGASAPSKLVGKVLGQTVRWPH
jgi:hypothetical protein